MKENKNFNNKSNDLDQEAETKAAILALRFFLADNFKKIIADLTDGLETVRMMEYLRETIKKDFDKQNEFFKKFIDDFKKGFN